MVAPALAAGASLASRAFSFAVKQSPNIIGAAQAYATKSGADLTSLIGKKDNNSQQMAVAALIKGGLDVASFTANSELTDAERKKLFALHDQISAKFRATTDATASTVAITDTKTYYKELATVSRSTGLSVSDIYRLKMVMGALTTQVVEDYEFDGGNRVYGLMADSDKRRG